jgi:hypothetical protein
MYRLIVLLMAVGLVLGVMPPSWAQPAPPPPPRPPAPVQPMPPGQQPGATVQASGYGTHNAFGTVVDADALTVGNQAIALR